MIPGKKVVTLSLAGEERAFTLDLAALAHAEDVYGGPLALDMTRAMKSFKGLRAILYGGLKRCNPSITIEAVDDMLEFGEVAKVMGQIGEAVRSALPQEGDVPLGVEVEPGAV